MRNFFKRMLPALALVTALILILTAIPTHPGIALALILPFGRKISKAISKDKANQMKNLDVQFISLVEVPANNKPVLIKSRDGKGSHFQIDAKIVKYDEKEGIAYGIAYPAEEVDLQNDFVSKSELQKTAHNFLLKSQQHNVDVEHNLQKGAGGVVESHILDAPDSRYPDSNAGDWGVAIKLSDEFKKSGKTFKGFSIYGTCDYVQKDAGADPNVVTGEGDPDGDGKLLQRLRVAAKVADTDMAEALQVSHDDYMAIENGEAEFDWTDPTIAAAAKKLKIPQPLFATLMNYDSTDDSGSDDGADNPATAANSGQLAQTSIDGGNGKSVNYQPTQNMKRKVQSKNAIAAEKIILSKGVMDIPVVAGADGQLYARPNGSDEKKKNLMKALASKFFDEKDRVRIEKATGDILSEDFGFFESTNVLNPELATELISIVVDQTPFLKKIQTKTVNRRDAEIDVMDIAPRSATRITPGSPAGTTAGQKTINASVQVHTREIDLVVKIDKKTIRETSNIASFEEQILSNFQLALRNEILDLGFNGVNNDYAGSAWTRLQKGWLYRLNQAPGAGSMGVPTAQNLSLAAMTGPPAATDMETIFSNMKVAGIGTNPRFSWDEMPFIISPVDMQSYRDQLKLRPDGLVSLAVTKGPIPEYDGNPLEKVNFIPTSNGILTHFQNLGVAILAGGGANGDGIVMERHDVEKAIQVIMTVQLDYFIVNPLAAVLLRP